MEIAVHIKKLLKANVSLYPSNNTIELREKDVMKVTVVNPPSVLTAVAMEKLGRLSGMKDGEWTQICDYLLVVSEKHRDQAIFVELKKTLNIDNQKALEQLRRSLPFLQYLRSVCEIDFGSKPITRPIDVRYVLIGERARRKLDKRQSVNPDPAKRRTKQKYKGIVVTTFVGSSVRFDLLAKQ